MSSTEHIKIFTDTVVKQTILQGKEDERKNPGTFSMGELAFTRDTARVFVGTQSNEADANDDDFGFKEGGLIVGNKYHGDLNLASVIEPVKYVSEYYNNNLYTGDFVFDTSDNSLVIIDKDKDIRIPSYTFNISPLETTQQSLFIVEESKLKNIVSINEEGLNAFINNKVSTGVTDLIVSNTCSLPKNITLTGEVDADTHNISFDLSKVESDTSYIITLTEDEEKTKVITPISTSDFFSDKLVSLKDDPQNPGIIVKNVTDGSSGTGVTYAIGLDSIAFIDKVTEIVKSQMDTQVTSVNQNRGLYYLSSLKPLTFTNNIIEKSITDIELSPEDKTTIPYTAQSVILQITSKPDSVTRIRHLKSNGVLLLELPENSSSQITTVEVPLIENDDMNDKKFTIHSTSNPTVKLLGYRI